MQQAARVSQRTAFFHLGNLVEEGPTELIFTDAEGAAHAGLHHRPVRLRVGKGMNQIMTEHTLKAFDADLQELTRMVAEMGGLAESEFADSDRWPSPSATSISPGV